jgi:hypothetical protein
MLFSTAHDRFLDGQSRDARREFLSGLVQMIAMGKSDGRVRAGPAELWASVWLAVVAYAVERVAAKEWAPDGGPVALTLEAAWDAIANREPHAAQEGPRPAS